MSLCHRGHQYRLVVLFAGERGRLMPANTLGMYMGLRLGDTCENSEGMLLGQSLTVELTPGIRPLCPVPIPSKIRWTVGLGGVATTPTNVLVA